MANEHKSQLSPFSPQDEKQAQKELAHLRKRLRDNEDRAVNVARKQTGFEDKTLWDKFNLFGTLAIPLVVALATIGFGLLQLHLADVQHQQDQQSANLQHIRDQQSALDQQRAAILQTYIDNIQDLLLNHDLLGSKPTGDVAILARARTLTALQGLDPERKGRLVQFIYEARLIGFVDNTYKTHGPIIDLSRANLSDANLNLAILGGVNLTLANLSGANLSLAILGGADLTLANLSGANLGFVGLGEANLFDAILSGADLEGAILGGANLTGAILSHANLSGANLTFANFAFAILSGVNLSRADLGGANLTQQQLDQVYSCKNANLPRGLTCHRNPSP